MRMLRGVSSGWALGALLAGAMGCGGGEADVSDGADGDAGCVEADEPDALGTDSNCDGVDGVVADSVFVDGAQGDDGNVGSREAPVATVGRGLDEGLRRRARRPRRGRWRRVPTSESAAPRCASERWATSPKTRREVGLVA